MTRYVKNAFFYLFAVVIIFSGQFLLNNGQLTGKPPLITQKMLNSRYMNDFSTKEPSIIYFWAKWCGICKMMQEPLNNVLKDSYGVTVIVKSGNNEEVRQYLQDNKLDWPVLNDPLAVVAETYKVKGVPAVFFLDKNGIIKLTATGYVSEIGLRLRLWLVQYL